MLEKRAVERPETGGIVGRMLELLGELHGREVLDAGCGEGFPSRILAASRAQVTGIDPSPRLIEMARAKDFQGDIDYRLADLSLPLPEFAGPFDLIACHLVLNDVRDYRGFISSLSLMAMPGARLVLAFNNPYSSVVREHIADYFASGTMGTYGGPWNEGIRARYYRRTLEEYLDAFLTTGLRLTKLADVVPERNRVPQFMVLAFEKPA